MKTLRFLGTALIATFICVACSNEEIVPEEQDAKYVTVDLGVTGEYLKVSESPMDTRTTSTLKDLIGIQVYQISENGDLSDYAWGVFTSLENVKIKLIKDKKYKFETSIIVDGYGCPEHLGHTNIPNWNTCYGFGMDHRPIGTDFNYSYTEVWDFFNFYNINAAIGEDQYKHDHFYGELAEYTPTENGIVTIEAKRTAYGAHYIAEGLTEGSVKIDVNNSNSNYYYSLNLTANSPENNGIFTFNYIEEAWRGREIYNENGSYTLVNYSSPKKLNISWTKADGSTTPLGAFDITFKRNVKTTIIIKVADPSQQNGIVITKTETRMSEDENKYVIEGGTITEVPVTSQQ